MIQTDTTHIAKGLKMYGKLWRAMPIAGVIHNYNVRIVTVKIYSKKSHTFMT